MSIQRKLLLFSGTILLPPAAIIALLIRMLYYRMKYFGDVSAAPDNRGAVFDIMLNNYAAFLGVIVFIALVGMIICIVVLLRSLLDPLRKLGYAVHKIEQGDLKSSVYHGKNDEFKPVFEQVDQMRIRLRDSLREQVRQEEMRRDMIASIAHDLKTPITSIRGYTEGLIDGVAESPEKREKYLKTILDKSNDLNHMAEALYDFSRLELQQMPLEKQTLPAAALMQDLLEESMYGRQGICLESDFAKLSPEIKICLDPRQTQRVVGNLLDNSYRYRRQDEVKINVSANENEERVIFCFADDGIGAGELELEKIFERFYRSDIARQNSGEGSGLGLSICRQIQKAQGGEIWARNNKEGGLSIYLSFIKEDKGGNSNH